MPQISHIINCPWCRSQFANVIISNCPNCGGPVEYQMDTAMLGPKPPMAPRALPAKFVRRTKYYGNVYTMIGMVFTIVFFWSVIFPLIGIFLWRKGIKDANDELVPLEHGSVVQGEIESIEVDHSKHVNGTHPYIVHFLFKVNGQMHSGNVGNIFDPVHKLKRVGDPVWVVYMPHDPDLSSVWPPLK
ncbi:MAG: hypothetical protein V4565_14520 [Bacteroidota bacterium]